MLFVLSPAKSLDYETPSKVTQPTTPQFVARSAELIDILKAKSPAEIAALMDLSDPLAALNVARYGVWSPRFTDSNSKPAVLAFNGDVYEGLDAASLSEEDLQWAQQHLSLFRQPPSLTFLQARMFWAAERPDPARPLPSVLL